MWYLAIFEICWQPFLCWHPCALFFPYLCHWSLVRVLRRSRRKFVLRLQCPYLSLIFKCIALRPCVVQASHFEAGQFYGPNFRGRLLGASWWKHTLACCMSFYVSLVSLNPLYAFILGHCGFFQLQIIRFGRKWETVQGRRREHLLTHLQSLHLLTLDRWFQ